MSGRWVLSLAIATVGLGCSRERAAPPYPGSSGQRLKPVASPVSASLVRQTVYVPVYSSIYVGGTDRIRTAELIATVSIRNVSLRHPLTLLSVRYFDSAGQQLREYLAQPSDLGPMATVEYVISARDTAGGPGANFLIEWAGPPGMDEPVIEALMLGQVGNAGYSFTSPGRVLKSGASR